MRGTKLDRGSGIRDGGWICFAALLLICTSVSAHDTWLIPEDARVATGAEIRLDLTSGMAFPALDSAISPERVVIAKSRLAGTTLDIDDRRAGETSLTFAFTPNASGIATVWVELGPRSLELTPAQVDEYLDEIGADVKLRELAKRRGTARWREQYTKHTKTFVAVGTPKEDAAGTEPVGLGLEIVPARDPTAFHAGDSLPLRVFRNGVPLPNFRVGALREGAVTAEYETTDIQGRALLKLPQAGRWLIRGTDLRPATSPDLEWESDFTTLTIDVR
jgi:uncharacterized GH25 family protein